MRNTLGLFVLAALGIAGPGCARHYVYGPAAPAYYGPRHHGRRVIYQQPVYQQQPVAYQQQPAVYQQQPVAYQQQQVVQPPPAVYQPVYAPQPVLLEQAPPAYYYQPTGHFRRPAIYRGVRVYVAE